MVDLSEKNRLSIPSTAPPETPPNMVELCLDTACSCAACAAVESSAKRYGVYDLHAVQRNGSIDR